MNARSRITVAAIAFGCGALFALGLVVSGMTQPSRVLGFLDVFGDWDPSLLWVMMGAIGANAPLTYLIRRRRAPLLAEHYAIPTPKGSWREQMSAPLLLGAALFGVGWGLAGYCPGPAIISTWSVFAPSDDAFAVFSALVFTLAMVTGMRLFSIFERSRRHHPEG